MVSQSDDSKKIAILQNKKIRPSEISIITSAVDQFSTFLKEQRSLGITVKTLSDLTNLSLSSIMDYSVYNTSRTSWSMAAKQSLFIARISDSEKRFAIEHALLEVEQTLTKFILSPLPSSMLVDKFSLADLHLKVDSLNLVKERHKFDISGSQIYSLNYKKLLLLYNLVIHDSHFSEMSSNVANAKEFIKNDPAGQELLVQSFLDRFSHLSLNQLSLKTGLSNFLISTWRNADSEYFKNTKLSNSSLDVLWHYNK